MIFFKYYFHFSLDTFSSEFLFNNFMSYFILFISREIFFPQFCFLILFHVKHIIYSIYFPGNIFFTFLRSCFVSRGTYYLLCLFPGKYFFHSFVFPFCFTWNILFIMFISREIFFFTFLRSCFVSRGTYYLLCLFPGKYFFHSFAFLFAIYLFYILTIYLSFHISTFI